MPKHAPPSVSEKTRSARVGVIGLGSLGIAVACRLMGAGCELIGYDHSPARASELEAAGARLAIDVAEACDAEIVFTTLSDDWIVQNTVFEPGGLLESMLPGAVHICCSKISMALSRRLSLAHSQAGHEMIVSALIGGPGQISQGRCMIAAGGEDAALERVGRFLNLLGQRYLHVGRDATTATLAGLGIGFLEAAVSEALSESANLLAQSSIEPAEYLAFVASALFNVPWTNDARNIVVLDGAGQQAPVPELQSLADIKLVIAAADDLQVPLPLASLLHDRLIDRARRERMDSTGTPELIMKKA